MKKSLVGKITLTVTGQEMLAALAAKAAGNPGQAINWLLANLIGEESEDKSVITMYLKEEGETE